MRRPVLGSGTEARLQTAYVEPLLEVRSLVRLLREVSKKSPGGGGPEVFVVISSLNTKTPTTLN
jgi:hypothetical protein